MVVVVGGGGGGFLKGKKGGGGGGGGMESHFESILELFILYVIVNPCMIDF